MEQIRHVIETARQNVHGQGGPDQLTAIADGAPAHEAGDFSYGQTRIVRLDPKHLDRHRIVAFNKSNPLSVSFDMLRTQVLNRMEAEGWRTLAVTSPTPGCGKTIVAINLAMSIAHHTGKTAMLADFDLRKPAIAKSLGLPPGKSLNDVLDGGATLAEALVNPGLHKLVVLPTSKPVPKSAEMLSSRKVESLIQDMRNRYEERIVIFDLPPLLVADDALTVLPRVDCALMVVGNGMVSRAEMEESLHHLHATNLVGTVLNKAEARSKKYYHY